MSKERQHSKDQKLPPKSKRSLKQRQAAKRIKKQASKQAPVTNEKLPGKGQVKVNESLLAPDNSYSAPDFVMRGYYEDKTFQCKDCGKEEVWRATQQKWWYEVAKGGVWTVATRCRPCRAKERKRKNEARQVHFEGLAAKAKRLGTTADPAAK